MKCEGSNQDEPVTEQRPKLRRGIDLATYSSKKGLCEETLRDLGAKDAVYNGIPAIKFEYRNREGDVVATRIRTAMHGHDRFRWKPGNKPCLYGLDRLKQVPKEGGNGITLVEGESDAQTLWYHGIAALGLPGASMWQEVRDAPAFDGFELIYVPIESDAGGETLMKTLAHSAIRDRVRIVRLGEFKDVSDMHIEDPAKFPNRWNKVLEKAVTWQDLDAEAAKRIRGEAWKVCKPLAPSDDILAEFVNALKRLGLVGERRNARILFLAMVSRLFDRPVSVAFKGQSSGGKSFLVETVLKFFPREAWFALTSMSEKALIYLKEDMRHRFLVFYEAEGMTGDAQSHLIRTLLSEGRIDYVTVVRGPYGPGSKKIELEGPTGLLVTTTKASLHPENETRLLSINVVDSPKQTKAIMLSLARRVARSPCELEPWLALQRWLSMGPIAVTKLLYHASRKKLKVGQKLPFSPRSARLISRPSTQETEDFLEGYRPDNCPSRTASWFACDDPDEAASFLTAQCEDRFVGKKYLYAIEMKKPSKHPMALVDGVGLALCSDGPARDIAEEYWEPSYGWAFWEYLSPEIRVVERLQLPEVSGFNLGNDMAVLNRYCAKHRGGYATGNSELPLQFE